MLTKREEEGGRTLYASTFLLYRSVGAATAAMLFTSKWKSPSAPSAQSSSPVNSDKSFDDGQYCSRSPSPQQWCWTPVGSFVSHRPVYGDQSQEKSVKGTKTVCSRAPLLSANGALNVPNGV